MSRKERIKKTLSEAFTVEALEIVNESHMHLGPRTESHYKVHMVSKDFESLSRLERQQQVYVLMKTEFDEGLHALSLCLKTPQQVSKDQKSLKSPGCKTKI